MSKVSGRRSPAADRFVELAATRSRPATQAEEFLSFVDLWRRSASASQPAGQEEPAAVRVEEPPDERELARREAGRMIEEARAEAARLKEEARREGRTEGERQGRAEAKKEYAGRVAGLEKIMQGLAGQRGAIIESYREELLVLVTTMTDRLVHHEISLNPEVIKSCFRGAMEYVVENTLVRAHLSPEDFHHLKEAGLADPALLEGKNRVQLIEDPTIAAGGCLLKSSFGEVDATLANRRDQLYQAVDRAFRAALLAAAAAAEADDDNADKTGSDGGLAQ